MIDSAIFTAIGASLLAPRHEEQQVDPAEAWSALSSFQLVNVVQDAPWDANGQHGQIADGLVLDAPGYVDDHALVQFDLLAIEDHRTVAPDDVVNLVGLLVVVQPGVPDLDVVDLGGGPVRLLD